MKSFPSLHYLVVPEPSTLFSLVQKWRKIPSRTKKLRDSFIYEKLLLRRERERKCDGEEGVGRGLPLGVSFYFPVHRPTIKARSRHLGTEETEFRLFSNSSTFLLSLRVP